MSAGWAIAPEAAWVEAVEGGGAEQVVWVARLDTGVQFELTDTGWLIWMLLSDGVTEAAQLHAELERIRGELGAGEEARLDADTLNGFLESLAEDGLLVRT
ncbi:MAG: hypothetical protein WA971_05800 [Microbacterium sp.]